MDVGDHMNGGLDVMSWYMNIPPISRVYFTSAFLTTTCCAMDLINPYHLYYNPELIIEGQIWRLFSPFLFFGLFSVDFVINMYFLIRHCRQLEEGDFRGKPAEFLVMILFGITAICCIAPFLQMHNFLGNALTYMMTYVWGRRNEDVRMSMLGIITFTAPWLPWVMLAFSLVMGNSVEMSILGIVTGHLYYFLEFVIPVLADARGWKTRKILYAPGFLRYICGEHDHIDAHLHID